LIEKTENTYNKRNAKIKGRAANRQFGASGGVVSWDTSQEFGSSPPVRALPIPPPDAKLLKRYVQADDSALMNRKIESEI